MSEERNEPPGMSSGDPLGSNPPPDDAPQDPPAAPQPPPAQPVEDLGPFMGTGAFAVPVPDDVEGDSPPTQPQPPQASSEPPAHPPDEPPTVQQPVYQPPEPQQPPPQQPEVQGERESLDPFGRPWPDTSGQQPQASHDPFGRPVQPESPQQPAAPPSDPGPQPSHVPGGLSSGDPLGGAGSPPPGGGFAPPTEQAPPGGYAPPTEQQFPPPGQQAQQQGYPPQQPPPPPGGYAYPPPPGGGYAPGQQPPGAFPSAPPPAADMPAAGQYTLAGWWSRVGATLIDGVVVLLAILVVGGIPAGIGAAMLSGDSTGLDVLGVLFIIVGILLAFVVALFYAPYWMSRNNGQTIGKKALGIRVVRVDGSAITLGFGALREIVIKGILINGVLGIIPFASLLSYLWPLWDSENRTWHDMLAKTRVVDA